MLVFFISLSIMLLGLLYKVRKVAVEQAKLNLRLIQENTILLELIADLEDPVWLVEDQEQSYMNLVVIMNTHLQKLRELEQW